ncbi:MAG TPA: diiron oxygenase [Micromonosporaceae bacterium]|jgi:hypothetical protein|nr:diiron oxygenase [Micromonosporaceae bacterium]
MTVAPADPAAAAREQTAERLLRASAEHWYDPLTEIDWAEPLAPDLYYVPPHRSTLFGTELWDRLSVPQRIELTKHEVASIASVGVWFETILMHMLIRLYYDADPTSRHAQYALTEIADECRHSVMFGRMIEKLGCPVYGVDGIDRKLGRWLKTTATGVHMFAAILIAEEILDTLQREAATDDQVQPLIRTVSRIHVVEEARHVRYARDELIRQVQSAGRVRMAYSRLVLGRAAYSVATRLVHPNVYAAVGIDPHVGRRAARANPYHQETLLWAARRVAAYLGGLGLIGGPGGALWRRAGLV